MVDGQLLIVHDLMGFYGSFRPSFAKCYIPCVLGKFAEHIASAADLKHLGRAERRDGLLALATMAIAEYVAEVRERKFPDQDYIYAIKEHELAALRTSKYWVEVVRPVTLSESHPVDGRAAAE
jgi:ketopantoate hydroxymethyltransferase